MAGRAQARGGGQADPLDFRIHRTVEDDGAVLSQTVATVWDVPIAGALLYRLRGKFSSTEGGGIPNPMGIFTFLYLRPPPLGAAAEVTYSAAVTPPRAAVNVTKDTEFAIDVSPGGEGRLRITYTPQAVDPTKVTTVTFFDQMQQ